MKGGGATNSEGKCPTDFELENKYTGMAAYMFVGVSLQSVTPPPIFPPLIVNHIHR